jgi:hypothetical protein
MPFLQDFSKKIGSKVKEFFDKKAEDRKVEEDLRREQKILEKIEYEKAFRVAAKKAAIIKAQRDAGKSTGLAKLRAMKRVENLQSGNKLLLPKLSEYINRNLKRREENLERTKMLKAEAEKLKQGKPNINKETIKPRYIPFSDLKRPIMKY